MTQGTAPSTGTTDPGNYRQIDAWSHLHLEQFLDSIVDNVPDMVFVKDALALRFVRVNKTCEQLLGHPREELIGKNDYDFFPAAEADYFTSKDRSVLASGKLLDIPEETVHTAAGVRVLHTKKIPILDEIGQPQYLLGISRDITRRKQNEERLREQNRLLEEAIGSERAAHAALKDAQGTMVQTAKMAALGQLVAGVAHEINNPLAFVANNIAVLQRDFGGLLEIFRMYQSGDATLAVVAPQLTERIRESAERIDLPYTLNSLTDTLIRSRDGLKRIQQIVKDLREFSRQEAVGDLQQGAELNPGIESTVNIVRGWARGQRVEVRLDLSPLPPVTCRPAKINQVVMNLVSNAIDACGEGGTVTVRSRTVQDSAGGACGIAIDVADTGTGIDAALRDRIFEPFFTTKPQGKGTGLGLSITHSIIAEHGGRIAVESEAGRGTTISIFLPLMPPEQRRREDVKREDANRET